MERIYLEASMIPAPLKAGYNGKNFKAVICTEMTIPMTAGLWDGGSRDTYRVVRLDDGAMVDAVNHNAAPWNGERRDHRVQLVPGIVVVEHSIFCGKDMGLTFYVHPDNAAKLLSAPSAELTPVEKLVLVYTATRKSSYAGKDRYEMAIDDARYGYGENPKQLTPSRDEWGYARQVLINLGLLNKAGAITVAGRNAVRS